MEAIINVLKSYGLDTSKCSIHAIGSGLIHHTWKIQCGEKAFVLQKINVSIFKEPYHIDDNIQQLAAYLHQHAPDFLFVHPISSIDHSTIVFVKNDGYYRLFPFVEGSHSIETVQNIGQAYEAARKFGEFTRMFHGFPVHNLQVTLRHFHDLSLRYIQFEAALESGNRKRRSQCEDLIRLIINQQGIVFTYEKITRNPAFKKRVTHHDTKISNVLFNHQDEALCVIDLDTCMPGYFISDVGDMLRTYLSPVSEEENDLSKINIREEYFHAIMKGYLEQMKFELSAEEKTHILYAGECMMYMQALRFLTDYLMDDVYYGAAYEDHNLVRARNQAKLLQCYQSKKTALHVLLQPLLATS